MKRIMSAEMIEAMKAWGERLNENRYFRGEDVDSEKSVRVTVTRHVGRALRTTAYEFGSVTDATPCYEWWMKRGGITDIEMAECVVRRHYIYIRPDVNDSNM